MTASSRPLKGVVLAAGLGARLRPITSKIPKPLIPFVGTTPLQLALWRLKELGVLDVAINTHHLAAEIAEGARSNPFSQRLHLSHEPEILGTGGAYNPLRTWYERADLVVLNGDVVSDIDLEALVERHRRTRAVATMMLLPSAIQGERGVYEQGGRVLAISKTPPSGARALDARNFACAQVLSPDFLDLLPRSGSFDVIEEGYLSALAKGFHVSAVVHAGYWHDLGTPSRYAHAIFDLLHEPQIAERLGVSACRTLAGLAARPPYLDGTIDRSAMLASDVVIERGALVGANVTLRRVIALPGSVVPPGAKIEDQLLWDRQLLPIQTQLNSPRA